MNGNLNIDKVSIFKILRSIINHLIKCKNSQNSNVTPWKHEKSNEESVINVIIYVYQQVIWNCGKAKMFRHDSFCWMEEYIPEAFFQESSLCQWLWKMLLHSPTIRLWESECRFIRLINIDCSSFCHL